MAPVDFSGAWKQLKRENEDSFVEKLGVPESMRKKVVTFPIKQDIDQNGDNFIIKGCTEDGELDASFCANGQFYDVMTPGGIRQAKSFWEGSRLVTCSEVGKGTMTITRELINEEIYMKIKCGPAQMVIIYGKDV